MANYTITTRTRKSKSGKVTKVNCIVANMDKLTENEREIIGMYLNTGNYELHESKPKSNEKKGLTREDIEKGLKELKNQKLTAEYNKMKEEKTNFMKISQWYKKALKELEEGKQSK